MYSSSKMSDDIRRKKKKQTKKSKAEDGEMKPSFVIEENIAKVSKKTAKDESEGKPCCPTPAKTVTTEKKKEQSTASVISKLLFFVSILGASRYNDGL